MPLAPEPWEEERPSNEITNLIDPYAGFDIIQGNPLVPKPGIGEVPGAAWRNGATGNAIGALTTGPRPGPGSPDYNVYHDIPERHFAPEYMKYYINSKSASETESISMKIDREERDNAIRDEYPVTSMVAGVFADPVFFFIPGAPAQQTIKGAYQLSLAAGKAGAKIVGPAAFTAQVGKTAAKFGAAGLAQQTATEALIQQTHITKSVADSFYDVGMTGLISTGLGALSATGVGLASIAGVRNAKSQATNAAAGIPDTPTINPKSKMKPGTAIRPNGPMGPEWPLGPHGDNRPLNPQGPNGPIKPVPASEIEAAERDIGVEERSVGAKGIQPTAEELAVQRIVPEQVIQVEPITRAVMETNHRVAAIPEWIQHATKFSVANQLQISPFATSPYVSRILFSNPLMSVANIEGNLASPRALDDRIFSTQQRLWNPARVKINEIYSKQLGVEGSFASGARARLADAMASGQALNKDQFALSVFNVLETNVKSEHASVNEAARILRNEVMLPIKKELVALNLMHPKFLEPQYDAYFHRMFNRSAVSANPNEFQALCFEFYKESRNFYRDNSVTIEALKKDADATKAELEALRARKDLKPAEKNVMIEELNKKMMREYQELYDFIPAEFMPADGHIPSIKEDPDLDIAANQTLMRVLGTDIESAMSLFGPGGGGSDPLQSRVLGMPNTYSADIVDSDGILRTVSASDFIEKDFDRVFSKMVRQLVPVIENTKLANELGFESITDLKRFLLESLEEDYNFMKEGKQGKEATKLTNQYKKDQKRIKHAFDVMQNVTGTDHNVYGGAYAKFMRHLADYNRVRLLGSAGLSAIPDLMVAPFRQGFDNLVLDWVAPFAKSMLTLQRNKAKAINAQDARNLGFALNVEMGKIAKALQNNDELLIKKAWWGKISEPIVNMLGNISGVNIIQDAVQNMAFSGSVSRSMRTIVRQIRNQKISERDRRRLRSIGIPDEDVPHIYDMWKEAIGDGTGKDGTVYYSDMGRWKIDTPERIRAYQNFRDATVRDVRQSQTVATAGDKTLIHQDTTVRHMLQFKDFLFAANNKILLSGLQKLGVKEYDVILSTMLMMGMGIFSYLLTSIAKDPTGESVDVSASKLFNEAMDRSALLGLWGEFKNIGVKAGFLPSALGEVSRFQSRGIVSSFVGPSVGTIEDLANFMRNVKQHIDGTKELSQKDINQLMRFVPYQNLFYLRYIFEQAAKSLGESIGAEE